MSSASFLFCGDFAPIGRFESAAESAESEIFGDLKQDIQNADFSFVNLEAPLCTTGNPIRKVGPHIRTSPDCASCLAQAGFDAIGCANNHIMDFGPEGLTTTVAACQSYGLPVFGVGNSLVEAQKPLLVKRGGLQLAFIAVAEQEFSIARNNYPGAAPLDPVDTTLQIQSARKMADLVFLTIHGGNEYFPYPRPGLRKLCHFLVNQGADAIICHHPHVPGAFEFHDGKPIIYSLGNLIFDHPQRAEGWHEGYAARLEYDVSTKKLLLIDIIPYSQSPEQGGARKMRGIEKDLFLERLDRLNHTLAEETLYAKAWASFCRSKVPNAILNQYFPFLFRGLGRAARFPAFQQLILPSSSLSRRENMIACPSHHELLLEVIRMNTND